MKTEDVLVRWKTSIDGALSWRRLMVTLRPILNFECQKRMLRDEQCQVAPWSDMNSIDATHTNGVLQIMFAKRAEARPKHLPVKFAPKE